MSAKKQVFVCFCLILSDFVCILQYKRGFRFVFQRYSFVRNFHIETPSNLFGQRQAVAFAKIENETLVVVR
jgi:hypothetical protein